MAHGERVDVTISVPGGLSDEDLADLARSFGATFAELVRAAEEEGGLVVDAHPGNPGECPDCADDSGAEVWAASDERGS